MITIAINGAAGRMGRRLVALAAEDGDLRVAAALEAAGQPAIGQDAGVLAGAAPINTKVSDQLLPGAAQVMIDFTVPAGCRAAIRTCVELSKATPGRPIALVIGTTGLTAEDHKLIDDAAKATPVLQAANMSLGVNLLLGLAAQVAARLGDDYDIEIVEAHHRMKADAPSGTALAIAQSVCEATGKSMQTDLVHGRIGAHVPRRRGEIGMHALRSGDVVGRHTISFGAVGEELSLTHQASTRDVFARGALRAAKWLVGKPAGRYSMKDVLGL
jgi:4-hydroxy-tetrahydrodipicolinate reductase